MASSAKVDGMASVARKTEMLKKSWGAKLRTVAKMAKVVKTTRTIKKGPN